MHCVDKCKNPVNVHSGQRSREIRPGSVRFDFINTEAGIYCPAQTIPGHGYRVEAWGKHLHSQSPVEPSLGVDLTGGEDWRAAR